MAYRVARKTYRTSSRRGVARRAGGRVGRSGTARAGSRRLSRSGGARTVRIEIVQAPQSAVARPPLSTLTNGPIPRKAVF